MDAPKVSDIWRTESGSKIQAWFLMLTTVEMTDAKFGVQIGHGTDFIHMRGAENPFHQDWLTTANRRKVILRIKSESDLEKIENACKAYNMLTSRIYDAGLTEFGKETLTGLVVLPHDDSNIPKPLQRTQAWKSPA